MVKCSPKMIEKMNNLVCTKEYRESLRTYKKEHVGKRLKENTIIDYCYEVKLFFNQIKLQHDKRPTLEQAVQWRDNLENLYPSKKTISKKIPAVNLYLSLVCGYPERSLEQVDNIERMKTPVKITRERIMGMVDFAESKGKHTEAMLIFVAFITACRRDSLHRIFIDHLDFGQNTILLKDCKGSKDLIVPMAETDMIRIKNYIDNFRPTPLPDHKKYLFIIANGKKVYPERLAKALMYCATKTGVRVKVHPHALRRARIWDLRKQGWRWEEIIKISGHKKIDYLMPYLEEEDFEAVHKKLNNNEPQEGINIEKVPPSEKSDIDKELELMRTKLELAKVEKENMSMQLELNGIVKPSKKLGADPKGYGEYAVY